MADRGLIILLILIIIVAGGILGYRRYIDLNSDTEVATETPTQTGGTLIEANTITTGGIYDTTDDFLNMNIGDNDVEKFNNNFSKYVGQQNGTTVRLMINAIRDNNASSSHIISIEYGNKTYKEDVTPVRSLISLGSLYNISFKYDSDKFIETIVIK